jgi:iron complex outermembrane recepter protein
VTSLSPIQLATLSAALAIAGAAGAGADAQTTADPTASSALAQHSPSPPDMPAIEGMTPTEVTRMAPMAALPPDIVVTGARVRRQTSLVASGAVLSGDELAARARSTIGETLAHQPGISSTAFGPSASRPVLRGFQGERGRLLIDGVGTLDVSNTSPDHAVALNPLVADRIELLRGPAALLYASGSNGGVVNTVSGRIPRRAPAGIEAVAQIGYGSAATEASFGARVDAPLGGPWVAHFDSQYLRGDSVETGGFILAPIERAIAAAAPHPAIARLERLRGPLPNTGFQTWEVGGGLSAVFGGGHAGFSLSNYGNQYGLPTRLSLDPATPQPDTYIALNQLRIDGRFEVDLPAGPLSTLRGRFAWADYRHFEIVRGGPISAAFRNLGYESRVEAVFGRHAWRATLGASYAYRDFKVLGAAPLLPPNRTRQYALFALHDLDLGRLKLEGAVRFDQSDVRAVVDPILRNLPLGRGFGVWAISGGANYALVPQWKLALNASYLERAPVVEELLTQGIDPGTQGQLIGNPALPIERSWGVEAVLRGQGRWGSATIAAHYTDFSSYIFPAETGALVQGLPVFAFTVAPARYWGIEAQGRVPIARWHGVAIAGDALVDYTEATLAGGAPVPRIPPLRLLAGMSATASRLDGRAEIEWTTPQSRVAAFETPTRGFVMVNLSLAWKPLPRLSRLQLRLVANNLFDAEARRHASFLKDFAPLAGRDVRLSARLGF